MIQLSEKTLGDYLEYWAEHTPDKEYIVYSDRNLRFTWKEFNQRVKDNMDDFELSFDESLEMTLEECDAQRILFSE